MFFLNLLVFFSNRAFYYWLIKADEFFLKENSLCRFSLGLGSPLLNDPIEAAERATVSKLKGKGLICFLSPPATETKAQNLLVWS